VLNDIACPAALTCYVAGTRLDRPDHERDHLGRQHSPTARNLYGIGCAGPATCFAVGDGGTILARR